MDVRRYQDADAPQLAALLERNSYGPSEYRDVLDADGLRRVFVARGVTDCMVGEKDGAIHGCIALSLNSGRRTLAADRRFAGLFVIDDAYRNSMLAGQLFKAIFTEAMSRPEVRSLHVEVDPANKRALPLYLRVGFRALPGSAVDEDGYLEMVSHLPGISRDILDRNLGAKSEAIKPAINWRMMRGGRNADASENLELRDGRWTISYPIDTGDLAFLAETDFVTGELIGLTQTKGKQLELPATELVLQPRAAVTEVAALAAGGLRCTVDSSGNIRVTAEDGTPLLHAFWPTVFGQESQATRRQQTRHRIRLDDSADGLVLVDEDSNVRLQLQQTDDMIELRAQAGSDDRVMLAPSVRLRPALHASTTADATATDDSDSATWQLAPVVRGLWPQDWTDFEFAAPVTTASEAWWGNGRVGVRMQWQGEARLEGDSAPLLRSSAPGEAVMLRLAAAPALGVPASAPEGMQPVSRPLRRRGSRRGDRSEAKPVAAEVALSTKTLRDNSTELTGGQHRIHVVPELGIASWELNGETVCKAPYPATGTFGSLASHRVAIWAALIPDTNDLDLGTVWFDDTATLPVSDESDAAGSRIVRAGEDELVLAVHGATTPATDTEQPGALPPASTLAPATTPAIAITPHTGAHPQFTLGVAGRLWRIATGGWRAVADQVAVTLRDGRALVIQPDTDCDALERGQRPRLMVRSVAADGAHITATAGPGVPLQLRLRVCASRNVAEAEMFAWQQGADA